MPIYEYACTACGERTEAKQSFADPPLTECSLCGGSLRKLYSPVGIVFKGSGFYSTDTKKKAASADGGKAASDKKDGAKGSTDSKSSKTDTKKESSATSTPKTDKTA